MDKNFVYHNLIDCLEQDKCPICTLIDKNIDKFIDGFLYESVNDFKIREDIKKAGGYCNYHAWRLQRAGDPLAHAIIYSDLINQEIQSIERYLKNRIEGKGFFSRKTAGENMNQYLKDSFYSDDRCPFCKMVDESEKTYISAFAEYMAQDAEFRDKYKKRGFLCVPHLTKLIDIYKDVHTIKQIMVIQLNKLKELSIDLSEIKRKADYRYSQEPMTESEKTAWIKAVRQWVGEPGFTK